MKRTIQSEPFGTTKDGRMVTRFLLTGGAGACVTLLDYGCTIASILVPDRKGCLVDVALGYETMAEYEQNDGYFGAAIGRVGNRIGGAAFELDGKRYPLYANDCTNTLHGGRIGFDRYVWDAAERDGELVFSRVSPDGEEGYPGTLRVEIGYRFTEDNALKIRYHAVSDADTLCSLTNHTYFNLNGAGDILDHELTLDAKRFLEADENCLPTGRILPVAGTPMDFTKPKPIGRDIAAPYAQLSRFGGYDHNYALDSGEAFGRAAVLLGPETGIRMTTETDQPGVQLYTGNFITPRQGKNGARYASHGAVCLETQAYPDAIHHADFPSCVLKKGETYAKRTVYRFSAEG